MATIELTPNEVYSYCQDTLKYIAEARAYRLNVFLTTRAKKNKKFQKRHENRPWFHKFMDILFGCSEILFELKTCQDLLDYYEKNTYEVHSGSYAAYYAIISLHSEIDETCKLIKNLAQYLIRNHPKQKIQISDKELYIIQRTTTNDQN